MTRRMRKAPRNTMLAKTSRGSWVAFYEVWDGDELLELRPLKYDPDDPNNLGLRSIVQAGERRDILMEIERAMLQTQLRETERELRRLTDPPPRRSAATA